MAREGKKTEAANVLVGLGWRLGGGGPLSGLIRAAILETNILHTLYPAVSPAFLLLFSIFLERGFVYSIDSVLHLAAITGHGHVVAPPAGDAGLNRTKFLTCMV
jgi:hypothetical protein